MVLIISAIDDISTNHVIDWLMFYEIPFLRISESDKISITKVELNEGTTDIWFEVKNSLFKISDFKSIWYRRSWIVNDRNIIYNITKKITLLKEQLEKQLNSELSVLIQHFVQTIGENSLNKVEDTQVTKLHGLTCALKCKFKIPATIITTSKAEALMFSKKHPKIITKNFSHGVFVFNKESGLNSYTQIVTKKDLNEMPDTFFPTLFQEAIEKKFELRIFFIRDEFYCSAIFSQSDEKTKIDFRNYNHVKPNRTPPFKLNNEDKSKLINLMRLLNMNSGSIDCIVNTQNELVFLEVNPIGQFAQVSHPCNYFLERKIADSLILNK